MRAAVTMGVQRYESKEKKEYFYRLGVFVRLFMHVPAVVRRFKTIAPFATTLCIWLSMHSSLSASLFAPHNVTSRVTFFFPKLKMVVCLQYIVIRIIVIGTRWHLCKRRLLYWGIQEHWRQIKVDSLMKNDQYHNKVDQRQINMYAWQLVTQHRLSMISIMQEMTWHQVVYVWSWHDRFWWLFTHAIVEQGWLIWKTEKHDGCTRSNHFKDE